MEYSELQEILRNSNRDDWNYSDDKGVYAYKGDLNLRISRKETNFDSDKFDNEKWATCHPDKAAYKKTFEVYYGSTFIEEHMLVSVDGGRAILPLPRFGTLEVNKDVYNFARIVVDNKDLEDYMNRSSLIVSDGVS
jgi:hypothetical protein